MTDKVQYNQKGSVVIYATFLMLVLSSVALLTALYILLNVRANSNSSNAINSFYAAESGLEVNLWELNNARALRYKTFSEATMAYTGEALSNGATFSTAAYNDRKNQLRFDLPLYSSRQINYSEPDTGQSSLGSNNADIYVSWEKESTCTGDADLEVIIKDFYGFTYSWNDYINPSGVDNVNVLHCATATCSSPGILSLQAGYSYVIKVKPLYCNLENVNFYASDGITGERIAMRNYIQIESHGYYGVSSTALKAETLWRAPLSGLGEYVIFSEEQIIK
ncbi:MAG: hypothetical protein V1898_05220 [Patescibacteria group bacterium]